MKRLICLSASILMFMAIGCGVEQEDSSFLSNSTGKSDGVSVSENKCKVILRYVNGPFNHCDGINPCEAHRGDTYYNWIAVVDVKNELVNENTKVGIKFKSSLYPDIDMSANEILSYEKKKSYVEGYTQYTFTLYQNTAPVYMDPSHPKAGKNSSATLWDKDLSLELIPLVSLRDGITYYDHNRNSGAFDNYKLFRSENSKDSHKGWSLPDDNTCK